MLYYIASASSGLGLVPSGASERPGLGTPSHRKLQLQLQLPLHTTSARAIGSKLVGTRCAADGNPHDMQAELRESGVQRRRAGTRPLQATRHMAHGTFVAPDSQIATLVCKSRNRSGGRDPHWGVITKMILYCSSSPSEKCSQA